ncbi:GNAT family N-acetyltransferase [Bradyrhizobium prioriisuperbiae]|uniref:GNAT family N-acetyltransferase n=1 Tax=Bradyrhizobium prioriisuperbiae TaxID=2854389 RepID=UPI0028E3CA6D|nr:GNAT family N-acetyltransferase [Bradyrhizobium prioritasuperba]
MSNEDMHSEREFPVIQRLRPHHVNGAKALIRDVWRENFEAHPDVFVRDFLLLPHALDDIDRAAGETGIGGLFLVQEMRGCVVATGAIRGISDDECELSRMFVATAWRKRGLATALARHLLDDARSRNFKAVRLMSNAQLAASHRLYHGLGFRACPSWDPQDEGRSISMRLRF